MEPVVLLRHSGTFPASLGATAQEICAVANIAAIVSVSLDEFGLVGDQFAPQFIGQAARLKPGQGLGCRREDSRLPRPVSRQRFAAMVALLHVLRKFSDDSAGQCLINSGAAMANRRRTAHRFGFGKHESVERQVPLAIPDELKIDWSSHDTCSRPANTPGTGHRTCGTGHYTPRRIGYAASTLHEAHQRRDLDRGKV